MCGTGLIFFSVHSVLLTAENLKGNAKCIKWHDVPSVTFESEAEPQLFLACS